MTYPLKVFEYQAGDIRSIYTKANSFDDALVSLSRGTYTVFRVFAGNRVLRFQDHIDRLEKSASTLGVPLILNSQLIREAVGCAVDLTNRESLRVCVLIPFVAPETVMIMVEEFIPWQKEVYQEGVRVDVSYLKRDNPSAKDSSFVHERKKNRNLHPEAHEILMCNEDGRILEGLSSNFYAVMESELRTASEDVLAGISRSILLEVAQGIAPIRFSPIHLSDCCVISEAFLTSSSRGVIPVVEIGKTRIGNGKPGPVTSKLQALFETRVEAELEPLFQLGKEK